MGNKQRPLERRQSRNPLPCRSASRRCIGAGLSLNISEHLVLHRSSINSAKIVAQQWPRHSGKSVQMITNDQMILSSLNWMTFRTHIITFPSLKPGCQLKTKRLPATDSCLFLLSAFNLGDSRFPALEFSAYCCKNPRSCSTAEI